MTLLPTEVDALDVVLAFRRLERPAEALRQYTIGSHGVWVGSRLFTAGGGAMLKPGAIVAVPLTDSKVAFARLLTFPFIEFYDVVVSPADISSFDLVTLSERQPTFTVLVHKSGATGRRWKRVGEDPTGASEVPGVFWQDLVDPTKIEIHRGDETVESATYEEVLEVEREAVWDPEHCEQRLRDHIAGTPNANREQLRPKRP